MTYGDALSSNNSIEMLKVYSLMTCGSLELTFGKINE